MSSLPAYREQHDAIAREDISGLVLDLAARTFRRGGVHVDNSVIGGTIERTMSGAATLTLELEDDSRALLRSGLFETQVDLEFDGQWWRLCKVAKAGDIVTLVWEHRVVSLLRERDEPRKASRDDLTRAEFALSLVREIEPPVGFVCPELHVRQPIAPTSSPPARAVPAVVDPAAAAAGGQTPAGQGFANPASLTVKGEKADADQIANAQRCLDVAARLGAGPRPMTALMAAVIVESEIRNLNRGDRDSLGILQVRQMYAPKLRRADGGVGIDPRNIEQCVDMFLQKGFTGAPGGGAIQYARDNPSKTIGQVAQHCQGSGVPGAYDTRAAEAARWVEAYTGQTAGSGTFTTGQLAQQEVFTFERGSASGEREDSWSCLQRLAGDVGWRCFCIGGDVWFISETALMGARPAATIGEDTLGVNGIDFDIDTGKEVSDATVTARARRWALAPGSVLVLDDCGPADGRWLVETVSRSLFDAATSIRLKRPAEPLPEPAAQAAASSGIEGAGGDQIPGTSPVYGGQGFEAMWNAAQAMHQRRFPYVWGGGHRSAGTPDRGTGRDPGIGYDCSGSTGALLAAAGFGYQIGQPIPDSGTMAASWGQPGRGQKFTLYANKDHVFLVFHVGGKDQHFGTGNWGKGWDGAGFNPNMHGLGGFVAKHWQGQ